MAHSIILMREKLAAIIGDATEGPAVDLLARVNTAEDYIANGVDVNKVDQLHELQESTQASLDNYLVPPSEEDLAAMSSTVEDYDRVLNG